MMARVGERPRFLQSLALLGPHRPRRKAPGRLAGLALNRGSVSSAPSTFPLTLNLSASMTMCLAR